VTGAKPLQVHRDLTTDEAAAIGVHLDLYDRESSLLEGE
jgi:hypothetical protein